MQPDPARDLVDAILAATPVHPVRGDVITGWTYEPDHPAVAAKLVHPWRPERGAPRPVAERQAAAARPVIYREAADLAMTFAQAYTWPEGGPIEDFVAHLRDLADKLTEETRHAD